MQMVREYHKPHNMKSRPTDENVHKKTLLLFLPAFSYKQTHKM